MNIKLDVLTKDVRRVRAHQQEGWEVSNQDDFDFDTDEHNNEYDNTNTRYGVARCRSRTRLGC